MATTAPTPFDVRLMNFTATLVFVLFALTLVVALAWWVLRQPFFPIAALKVDGEEVTCAVLGNGLSAEALPVVRIAAPEGAYDYQNKYFTDDVKYHCPSGLPEAEEREIQRIVLAAYRTLGGRGWSRVDLMIRAADRKPFLLEMNTSPGMTSHSLVPMSARAAGIDYAALCLRILAAAALDYSATQRRVAVAPTETAA